MLGLNWIHKVRHVFLSSTLAVRTDITMHRVYDILIIRLASFSIKKALFGLFVHVNQALVNDTHFALRYNVFINQLIS